LQIAHSAFILSCEAKIDQLDILIFVQQYVLELQIAVYAGLLMDVGYCANELCEDLLHFRRFHRPNFEEVVVELVARDIL
jgi:hypothetical protein